MSHEHKLAIQKITTLCESSRTFTRRIERIYDICLEAQGMTSGQRAQEAENLKKKIAVVRAERVARILNNKSKE